MVGSCSSIISNTKRGFTEREVITKKGEAMLRVRAAVPEDYDELMRIMPQVTRCSMRHKPEVVKVILAFGNCGFFPFVVAGTAGKVVAYAGLYTMIHPGRPLTARLEHVVVDVDFRGYGIGKAIVDAVVAFARDVLECDRCDMTVENPVAMHIYEAHGFKPVDTNCWRVTWLEPTSLN